MADWRAVLRHHTATGDYIRHRRWVRRGDLVAYAPNLRAPAFSTDHLGFRRTVWKGRTLGLGEVLGAPKFGLVMGSSHVFGFGLPSDAATLASALATRFGMPMANISFPEADTRSLHSVLVNLLSQGLRPSYLCLATGGDFTRHAFSGASDPVFGSRNVEDARPPDDLVPDDPRHALSFSRLWTATTLELARQARATVGLVDDMTFMEKLAPSSIEAACGLGQAGGADQLRRFSFQRAHGASFYAMRRGLAIDLGVPLAGVAAANLEFIDEFHLTAPALALQADAVAAAMV